MERIQQAAFLIESPERVTHADAAVLRELVAEYPYFQPLRLLLAKATLDGEDGNTNMATAALYTNGHLLHAVLHEPETLLTTNFQLENEVADAEDLIHPVEEITNTEPEEQVIEEINVKDYQHIVSTDFFAFQDNFKVEALPEIEEYEALAAAEMARSAEENVVSKYDDDKLPYTFLWWLAKTRKEHAQIFQPYASPRTEKKQEQETLGAEQKPSELQQQYVEHIFHIQTPFNAEELLNTPETDRQPPKGMEIIENFIKNEPHIRAPKADEINTENKARKSAEDQNDLVTETLAKIYIEQMLYDKAIETYQKLSLKFPEKSRYFADLIQSIEKKI